MEKLKKFYCNNVKEIAVGILTFLCLSMFQCPFIYRLPIVILPFFKNNKILSIGVIISMILNITYGLNNKEDIMILNIMVSTILFIVFLIIHLKQNKSKEFYHNRILIYLCSVFILIFGDICINNLFEGLEFTYIYLVFTATIRLFTVFLIIAITDVLLIIFKNKKLPVLIFYNLLLILNIINYWVYTITNQPLMATDILILKTVGNVISWVSISNNDIIGFIPILLLFGLFNFIFIKFIQFKNYKENNKKDKFKKIFTSLIVIYAFSAFVPNQNKQLYLFTERYGLIANLFVTAKPLELPNGYENFTKEIEEEKEIVSNEKKPNVIVIMNEAFSDLSLVYDDFNTSSEYIPYTKSLMKEYPSGITYASIIGNNTVSSEFEFLTGIPTGLTTRGSVMYKQYVDENSKSIVDEFENNGYRTIGIHPFTANGYNRDKCWEYFGFDETYFDTDFKNTKNIKEYISDESFYDKIIELHKENKSEPLFVFGISMQNHASYGEANMESEIKNAKLETLENEDLNTLIETNFDNQLNEYITLSNISDKALKKLIDYFESVDEDTIILYYGDHQPMLDITSTSTIDDGVSEEFMNKYKIPYILWSNYDLKVEVPNETSINYLSGILFDGIKFNTSSWFEYINNIKKEYPVVTENFIKNNTGEVFENSVIKSTLEQIENPTNNSQFIDLKKYQCWSFNRILNN